MDYRKFGDAVYIRMDRGDEIIGGIWMFAEKNTLCLQPLTASADAVRQRYRPIFLKQIHLKCGH